MMKENVLSDFLKEYKEYVVDTDHTPRTAGSYCSYLRNACKLLDLGEGFLEAISAIADVGVKTALCEYMMAKLYQLSKNSDDKDLKTDVSNSRSALSLFQDFVANAGTPAPAAAASVTPVSAAAPGTPTAVPAAAAPSLPAVSLPNSSVYTQKELLKIFHSRLSTQDRFYVDACFPARVITKINAKRGKLRKKTQQVYHELSLHTKFLIDKGANSVCLKDIDKLTIQTDGSVKIAVKRKEYDLYTEVYRNGSPAGYELLRVNSVAQISLDHEKPMRDELPKFLTSHSEFRSLSDSVKDYRKQHPQMNVPALSSDYFDKVYPTLGLNEDALMDEISAFLDSLQLIILHKSYNSSKSDNVTTTPIQKSEGVAVKTKKEKIDDFYGQRVYSATHGYGKLTKVYGEEVYVTYDKGGSYIYQENPFPGGVLTFCDPELTEQFNAIYENYVHSKDGRFEIYDTWFRRGS